MQPYSIPARDHKHGRKLRKDPGVGGIFGNCVSPSPCMARVPHDFIFDESNLGREHSVPFCRVWRNGLTKREWREEEGGPSHSYVATYYHTSACIQQLLKKKGQKSSPRQVQCGSNSR